MRGHFLKISPGTRARELQSDLEMKFPDLTVSYTGSRILIRGAFPVLDSGLVLDRYQIEIEWSDTDSEAPLLYETGGRIPWIGNRHVNTDGRACVFVPEEWLIHPREERTLIRYLDGPVRDFFLWQSLFERGESVRWRDRSHGIVGLIESYGEMIGLEGESAIRCCLEYLSKEQLKGHWTCYCGSAKRIRNCHLEELRALRLRIPQHIAHLALTRLDNPTMR